jgi:fatty acid synthase subunit beta
VKVNFFVQLISYTSVGIHVNILFLNPKLWGFQYPSCIQMRQEGIPIDSITIAAGVPSLEKATEILTALKESGMRYVAFKPGSVGAIKDVVRIAKENKDMMILVQWTGGRAGGHHSFEDLYEPIIETYASLRRQSNIVLIVGGGFGGYEESVEWLKGTWSKRFGYPPMPFDGILLGSRVMAAKEALTSDEAKELIVKTVGVPDKDWEKSYEEDAGGVITVISELGEPIHKIATRGIRLWKEFDKKFFSLPGAQQEKAILENKDYIIKGLNADFQKVYFGRKRDGKVVDLDYMTYLEVTLLCCTC